MNASRPARASSRRPLCVLLADGRRDSLDLIAAMVTALGHVVLAKETDIEMVAALSELEPPDVAIVVAGDSGAHTLELIRTLVREATCPVILLLADEDPRFVGEAAKLGVFAYLARSSAMVDGQLESAFSIVMQRFAEYHDLQGAFGRRALIERAKGILMERHSIAEDAAFQLLRERARNGGRKLTDVAQAVIDARALLPSDRKA